MAKFKDITGLTYGRLTVVAWAGSTTKAGNYEWMCRCACGQTTKVAAGQLKNGSIKSCGCLRREFLASGPQFKDLTDQRFGRLIVIAEAGGRSTGQRILWLCQCDCGARHVTNSGTLLKGTTISCGCFRREVGGANVRTHGKSSTPEHSVWGSMLDRCLNPNGKDRRNYRDRGITVCERWRISFQAFLDDVGPRPGPDFTIGRIDNNKGYEPGNVRWETQRQQQRNRRSNWLLTLNGETKTLAEWVEGTGLSYYTVYGRVKYQGWDLERALRTPVRTHH